MKNLSAAVLLALAPMALVAAEHGRPGPVGHFDMDRDGVITRDEAQAAANEHVNRFFERFDADKDGVVTRDEMRQAHEQRRAQMREQFESRFAAADENGDGSLSKAEAEKGMPMVARNFERLDQNSDGGVTLEELKAQAGKRHRGRR